MRIGVDQEEKDNILSFLFLIWDKYFKKIDTLTLVSDKRLSVTNLYTEVKIPIKEFYDSYGLEYRQRSFEKLKQFVLKLADSKIILETDSRLVIKMIFSKLDLTDKELLVAFDPLLMKTSFHYFYQRDLLENFLDYLRKNCPKKKKFYLDMFFKLYFFFITDNSTHLSLDQLNLSKKERDYKKNLLTTINFLNSLNSDLKLEYLNPSEGIIKKKLLKKGL